MGNKEILKEKERSRMRYDDIETERERRRRKRTTDLKVAAVMILLFFIGFIVLIIWSEGEPISPLDEEKSVIDESEGKNGEIIHPTENEATTGQQSLSEMECVDGHILIRDESDGGMWVISAFPVPDEWRSSGDNKEEVTDAREQP